MIILNIKIPREFPRVSSKEDTLFPIICWKSMNESHTEKRV